MPWLNRRDYKRLLRKANENLLSFGKDEWKQNINDIGFLLWRLNPQRADKLTDGMMWPNPFEHIDVCVCGEKVFIFVVHNDQGIIFEDTRAMYPSDELIAKLRILMS